MADKRLNLTLPAPDLQFCARGVALYCKHLDGMEKEATTIGLSKQASDYESEAAGLRAEIVEPAETGEPVRLYTRHRRIVEKGLELLTKNMKAAKGTAKALGYEEWVSQLEADAAHVEGALLPLFQEQGELPLAPKGAAGETDEAPVRVNAEGAAALHLAVEGGA
jgi:hypothetical protein